ncbi:MAG: hypothetical protein HOL85_12125 [Rhodospirillaceae bacterium]|jgi:hypothetical protein|nr:hypothetical protein [Rhodospirillaceae bacterium]MBT6136255.1 hypothetical protein [Rhodospirillaceae bacterium]
MGTIVTVAVIAGALFADMIVEVGAEVSTDVLLEDDAGVISEPLPLPQGRIVNMLPGTSVEVTPRPTESRWWN